MRICKIIETGTRFEMVREIDKSFEAKWDLIGPVQFHRLPGFGKNQYTTTLVKEKQ